MYDLHTHSYHSDGVLGLAELARRCEVLGCRGLAVTDHCDRANLESVLAAARLFCESWGTLFGEMKILAGCELTHAPPSQIPALIAEARQRGADLVLVHGETVVEPVARGTNMAAIEGGADVLAHPGLITEEEVALAAEKGIRLEITARKGHCLTNGHVARLALQYGCKLSFGSDGHAPGDYQRPGNALSVLTGAGLTGEQAQRVMKCNEELFTRRRNDA